MMRLFADTVLSDIADASKDGQTYSYWSEFVNMLLTLGFILALVILSVWALKKIMRSRVQHLNRSTGIKILERRVLAPKSSLFLVDILGKGVVIAESPSGVQKIVEFDANVNVEEMIEALQESSSPRISLTDKFVKKFKLPAKNG